MINQTQELLGAVVLLVLFVASALLWNYYWIKPHDKFVFAVMDCLDVTTPQNAIPTQDEYEVCAKEARDKLERR